MNRKTTLMIAMATVWLAVLGGKAFSAQGKYALKVPGGLAFADANGKPVPDGAKMAKVHWIPKQNQFFPTATVPLREAVNRRCG